MRVKVDFGLCEANALCVAIAPDVFQLDDDDYLMLLQEEPAASLASAVEQAARSCPRSAILVED